MRKRKPSGRTSDKTGYTRPYFVERGKSLAQLMGGPLTRPGSVRTSLIERCESAYERPISQLSVEDLDTLLSQQIGAHFLVPVALEKLAAAPLVRGHYLDGGLLLAVTDQPESFWKEHPLLRANLVDLLRKHREVLETCPTERVTLLLRYPPSWLADA